MPYYVVHWKIDISADSPRGAAQRALEIQRDASSIATVFEVVSGTGELELIDLEESFTNPNDRCPVCDAEIEPTHYTDQMGEIVYATNPKERTT